MLGSEMQNAEFLMSRCDKCGLELSLLSSRLLLHVTAESTETPAEVKGSFSPAS